MNSTLGSVVPLAIFLFLVLVQGILVAMDEYQKGVKVVYWSSVCNGLGAQDKSAMRLDGEELFLLSWTAGALSTSIFKPK